jgi:hypothetical protein
MVLAFQDFVERGIDGLPFGEQFFEDFGAERGKSIEALVALVCLAPFAKEKALGFQAAEERVKSSLFDLGATVGQGLSEGVAVLFGAEASEDCEDKRAAAEF